MSSEAVTARARTRFSDPPMFVGHLAAGLAAKRLEPELPLGLAVGSAFLLDLAWPVLLLLGVEVVRVQPGDTAFTGLTFESYPWSHSLLMVMAWAALFAGAVWLRRRSTAVAVWCGVLVASHWILDVVTHRPDLPLWPSGPVVGLGLWNSIVATIVVEGTLLAVAVWLYVSATRPRDGVGRGALVGLLGLTVLVWLTQPWSPPPPSAQAVAWGGFAAWLLVPWAAWIERHREGAEGRA